MVWPKKPVLATLYAVKITRDGEYANIEYKDPAIGGVGLKIGPDIAAMTDQEILDLHNHIIRERENMAARYNHIAVEILPGKPQIEYSERCAQWVPRGDVLRCLIHDDQNLELVVEIDGRDLSLKEFGRMLTTHAGWGMRIVFVPDDEIEKEPDVVVGEKKVIPKPRNLGTPPPGESEGSLSCSEPGRLGMTYETIEDAYHFVNGGPPYEHTAVIHRGTGEGFFASEMAGYDDIPEEAEGSEDYLWIPHKHDLDLGKPLVMSFVLDRCPELYDEVSAVFRRKGAYGRFKDLLDRKDLLQEWYAFEEERTREALHKWCAENGVELE
ncbi:MAG: UPF0158 family protein [bacterium]|nr:UPF0158 family protein [bacterium]MDT8396227.1 UPF0158 family protein [bacterium]